MIVSRALHYAHGKKTFHRDVKPGNVLLTLHNGPQLLDFNLAESPHSAGHAQDALHGGTLPYMAPEQIEAFINPDLWGKVGARAMRLSRRPIRRRPGLGTRP
jgi:serine/threonine protein kinase